jgi:hypothetical protein
MKEPKRPAHVPPEAVWSSSEAEWQLGETITIGKKRKAQCAVGEWRYWRADGTLCCIANFNKEGFQDGILERFHNDGTLASSGVWKNGSRAGHFVYCRSENPSDENYPSNFETWRYEFDSNANWEEHNLRWYLKDGTECTSDGRPLDTAYDLDTLFGAAEPDGFLEKYAEEVSRAIGADHDEVDADDPLKLEELWGVKVPEIDKFILTASDADSFSVTTDRRMFEDGNVWDLSIQHCWMNDGEELGALFLGAVKIGGFGDSDSVYATIFRPLKDEPAPNAVYYWSHDTYYVDEVLAPTLDDFAYRIALAGAVELERLSPAVTKDCWTKLIGRCSANWAASAGIDTVGEENFQDQLDPGNKIRGNFWRAQWIIELLKRDEARNWSDIQECFRPNWNKVYDDDAFATLLNTGKRLAPTALYLLWRFFWFKQNERLQKCLDAYRDHSARAVRDLVLLLEEIQNGRKQIGKAIADIFAVREEFLALDLAPENAEQRAAVQKENAAADAVRAGEFARKAMELKSSKGLSGVLDEAWACVADPIAMSEFEKAAREFPGHEMQWRAFDWIREFKYVRDSMYLDEEAFGVGVWLGENKSEVLQPFIWATMHTDIPRVANVLLPAIGRTKGALDSRLAALCIARLDMVEEYHHKRELAVRLLQLMDHYESVPRLIGLLDEFFSHIETKSGYDVRLAAIPWDEILVTICGALQSFAGSFDQSTESGKGATSTVGKSGGTDSGGTFSCTISDTVRGGVRKLLNYGLANSDAKIASAAMDALTVWGETDLLEAIERMLRINDDIAQISAFRAIETIFSKPRSENDKNGALSDEKVQMFLALTFRNPSEDDNAVTLMFHRAALVLQKLFPDMIEADSISEAIELARELENYGTDRYLNWRLIECETVAKFPELDVTSIAPYLRSAQVTLQDAARKAFTARGITPAVYHPLYWPVVWAAVGNSGIPAEGSDVAVESVNADVAHGRINELILDPQSIDLSAPAGWLWENPAESSAAALAEVVIRALDNFVPPGRGEYLSPELTWLIRALMRHGKFKVTESAINRCLKFEDEAVSNAAERERQAV